MKTTLIVWTALLLVAPATADQTASVSDEGVRAELRDLNESMKQLLLLINESLQLQRRSGLVEELARLDETIAMQERGLRDVEAEAFTLEDETAKLRQEFEALEDAINSGGELAEAQADNLRFQLAERAQQLELRDRRLGELQAKTVEFEQLLDERKRMRDDLEDRLSER